MLDRGTKQNRNIPVEVGSLSHCLRGFYTYQVVQDFFHQQYYTTWDAKKKTSLDTKPHGKT